MSFIKRRSDLIVSTIVVICIASGINSAYANNAENEPRQHDSEYISEDVIKIPQIPWDIIGTHTARAIGTEKFINPAMACERVKEKDDDYLLQLQLCKEERKGWLKI